MTILIRNHQRTRSVDTRQLRQIVKSLLVELKIAEAELGIHIVAESEMIRLNETYLKHRGSTDVITFDYSFGVPPSGGSGGGKQSGGRLKAELRTLQGEILVCMDEAILQARRFRTTWQSELIRYIIHGLLHLSGHADKHAAARKKMKRVENDLLRQIAKQFSMSKFISRA
jgi:probable rRNA maturation factor